MKVTLLMAITLDGKIAQSSDHFPDWTGKADKKFFMEETKKAGGLIMGSKTYDTIGRPLPGRKNVIMTRSPESRINEYEASQLEFTSKAPAEITKQLEQEGFKAVILGGGAEINTLFAEANLIDEIVLTISPLVFGNGISLFNSEVDLKLELTELTTLDDNLVCVRYKVLK
jgi:dihydrofolate reductase